MARFCPNLFLNPRLFSFCFSRLFFRRLLFIRRANSRSRWRLIVPLWFQSPFPTRSKNGSRCQFVRETEGHFSLRTAGLESSFCREEKCRLIAVRLAIGWSNGALLFICIFSAEEVQKKIVVKCRNVSSNLRFCPIAVQFLFSALQTWPKFQYGY